MNINIGIGMHIILKMYHKDLNILHLNNGM
jgi:hypothetical protein